MTCWLCGFETTKLGTDANAPMCKNGTCQICTSITEIDEEINQAEATLRRLIVKRCNLRSEHNRVHGTLMNRLPVELRNRIFELLLPPLDEWGKIPRTGRSTGMPSFLASISVCRGWRDSALSNPFLWSTMHFVLRRSSPFSRINDWILRSQSLPVSYHIQVIDDDNEGIEWSGEVANIISRCSDRLQSLSFFGPLPILCDSQHDNNPYHRLTRLKISSSGSYNEPLSLLNPTASPEKIELEGVPIRFLQISWDRLTSATVDGLGLKGLTQLFQHASQMIYCQVLSLRFSLDVFPMPPIVHHRLKTLILRCTQDWGVQLLLFFDSLTLPCLQVLSIKETILLKHLPALMHRSSCPLTKLLLNPNSRDELPLDDFQPLTGVTDLVVEASATNPEMIKRLLLEGYFPDLRHLIVRLQPFWLLWDNGVIPLLLDRKRSRPDKPNEGRVRRLDKFLVVDPDRASSFDWIWTSDVGEQLKKLNIRVREDGFEFL